MIYGCSVLAASAVSYSKHSESRFEAKVFRPCKMTNIRCQEPRRQQVVRLGGRDIGRPEGPT